MTRPTSYIQGEFLARTQRYLSRCFRSGVPMCYIPGGNYRHIFESDTTFTSLSSRRRQLCGFVGWTFLSKSDSECKFRHSSYNLPLNECVAVYFGPYLCLFAEQKYSKLSVADSLEVMNNHCRLVWTWPRCKWYFCSTVYLASRR